MSELIKRLPDFAVLPLRKLQQSQSRFDWACWFLGYAVCIAFVV
jgi:hypothetical protein